MKIVYHKILGKKIAEYVCTSTGSRLAIVLDVLSKKCVAQNVYKTFNF